MDHEQRILALEEKVAALEVEAQRRQKCIAENSGGTHEDIRKVKIQNSKGVNELDANTYLALKKYLIGTYNGEGNLDTAVTAITEVLQRFHLDQMPHTAYQTLVFTLQTIHFAEFNDYLCLERVLNEIIKDCPKR